MVFARFKPLELREIEFHQHAEFSDLATVCRIPVLKYLFAIVAVLDSSFMCEPGCKRILDTIQVIEK